jgi:hypothetical protein
MDSRRDPQAPGSRLPYLPPPLWPKAFGHMDTKGVDLKGQVNIPTDQ